MKTQEVTTAYVRGNNGKYYVQSPSGNQWGFILSQAEGDWSQSWDGGFGSGATEWVIVPLGKVPRKVRKEMDWLLEVQE
jgi:hypothetical protein